MYRHFRLLELQDILPGDTQGTVLDIGKVDTGKGKQDTDIQKRIEEQLMQPQLELIRPAWENVFINTS